MNEIGLILGVRGAGKTPAALYLADRYLASHPKCYVIVIDDEDHEAYRHFETAYPADFSSLAPGGKYRCWGTNAERLVELASEKCYNALVILEDTRKYLSSGDITQTPLYRFCARSKNRNQDVLTMWHSLDIVPPRMVTMANFAVILNSEDPRNTPKLKQIQLRDEFVAAWERVQAREKKRKGGELIAEKAYLK